MLNYQRVIEEVTKYNIWLVAWNIWITFPYIGNFIIPTDELIFFGGVETTNQIYIVKWDNSSIGKILPCLL